jgi:large subunit ribosomal protein L24e
MSHKTEVDGFDGHLIQPGHGRLFVRVDKHLMAFQSRKTYRMWDRKRNPRKIAWTEHYRHDHKKSTIDLSAKSTRIQRKKVQRGYAGVATAAAAAPKQAIQVVKQRTQVAKRGGKTGKK